MSAWIDNTGELASLMPRAGNAGSNTAVDLIAVLTEAIAQVSEQHGASRWSPMTRPVSATA